MPDRNGISILIVNYNGEKYIEESITSLEQIIQSYEDIDYEFLIADNNSQDQSINILYSIAKKNSHIESFFLKENLGFARANNFLAKKARYQNLLLINNDTKSLEVSMLLELVRNNNVDRNTVYTCNILNRDGSKQQNIFGNPSKLKLFVELLLIKRIIKRIIATKKQAFSKLQDSYFSGCFLFFDKELFINVGGFDERFTFYHEEADFFLRLGKSVEKRVLNDKIIHYGGGGGEMSDFAFINYYLGIYKLFLFNKLVNRKRLRMLFLIGFRFRIALLKLGLKINYQPIDMYKNQKRTRSTKEIINLHRVIINKVYQIEN